MDRYKVFVATAAALIIFLICASPASAYLDPATGSMIVQAVIAAFAAVSVFVGIFWRRLRAFFGRKNKEDLDDK